MEKNTERIEELVKKVYDGNACVFARNDVAPKTFVADMAALFKADPVHDVLRGVYCGDEEGLNDCNMVVIPGAIESNDLFIKLADYVNGTKMEYAFCCCKDKESVYRFYSIYPNDEYVEGGAEPMFSERYCPVVGEENVIFIIPELNLGAEDDMLPSPTVMFIEQGEHYIDHLIGPDYEDIFKKEGNMNEDDDMTDGITNPKKMFRESLESSFALSITTTRSQLPVACFLLEIGK